MAVDGDGQFLGADVVEVIDELLLVGRISDVVEGVRTSRNDPLYRKLVSSGTRALVWSRVRQKPADANTPLRAYRPSALVQLLQFIPEGAATPNLHISAISRALPLRIREVQVRSIPRRGSEAAGSTWGKSRKSLPSKRFVVFCATAAREWVLAPWRRVD